MRSNLKTARQPEPKGTPTIIPAVGSRRKIRFEFILPHISTLGYRTYLTMYRAGIVAYIFKISALREQRQVQSQPALQNKFQDRQGYPEKPFLETLTFSSKNPHKNKQKFAEISFIRISMMDVN